MKPSLWKKFPRWAIAGTIVAGSTLLFAVWWFFLRGRWSDSLPTANSPSAPVQQEPDQWGARAERAATIPSRMGGLVVVGDDLYDIVAGELVFKKWLQGGTPPKLFMDSAHGKVIGQIPRGLIRYELTGKKEKVMGEPMGVAFSDGFKLAVYAKGGDIWKAVPDWASFTLTEELQVTKLGKFNDSFLVGNIMMGTENSMIVRQMPNLLSVDLKKGDVTPLRMPPGSNFKNQSPDGRLLVGMRRERGGGSFFAYDVEKDDAKTFPLGRKVASDFLWLSNDRCAVLAGGEELWIYNRGDNSFKQLMTLAATCNKLLGPSVKGRRFFCGSRKGAFLIDVEGRSALLFNYPAENMAWISDEELVFSNDQPDTSTRGTYFMTAGKEPARVSEEPYLAGRDGRSCVEYLASKNTVAMGTKSGLFRMDADGGNMKQVVNWQAASPVMIQLEEWEK